jgi:hypothetical protein
MTSSVKFRDQRCILWFFTLVVFDYYSSEEAGCWRPEWSWSTSKKQNWSVQQLDDRVKREVRGGRTWFSRPSVSTLAPLASASSTAFSTRRPTACRPSLDRYCIQINVARDYSCVLCNSGCEETMFHLFFECPFSRDCWLTIPIIWNMNLSPLDMILQARADFDNVIFR